VSGNPGGTEREEDVIADPPLNELAICPLLAEAGAKRRRKEEESDLIAGGCKY
jgi:hypothetical protein